MKMKYSEKLEYILNYKSQKPINLDREVYYINKMYGSSKIPKFELQSISIKTLTYPQIKVFGTLKPNSRSVIIDILETYTYYAYNTTRSELLYYIIELIYKLYEKDIYVYNHSYHILMVSLLNDLGVSLPKPLSKVLYNSTAAYNKSIKASQHSEDAHPYVAFYIDIIKECIDYEFETSKLIVNFLQDKVSGSTIDEMVTLLNIDKFKVKEVLINLKKEGKIKTSFSRFTTYYILR